MWTGIQQQCLHRTRVSLRSPRKGIGDWLRCSWGGGGSVEQFICYLSRAHRLFRNHENIYWLLKHKALKPEKQIIKVTLHHLAMDM